MQFFHLYKTIFFSLFFFLIIMMSIRSIVSTIKKMVVKELGDSIYEKYHSQIGLTKENSYYLIKRQKKNCNCLQQN